MKNLFLILIIALLIIGCEVPIQETETIVKETETIITESTEWYQCYNERTGEDYILNPELRLDDGTLYPISRDVTSSIIFEGWMNINNAYETTGIWNNIDISAITGSTEAFIIIRFEHTDGELTEYGEYQTKATDSIDVPDTYSILRNVQTAKGLIWTDDLGTFDWCSNYPQPISKQAYLVIRIIMYAKTK